MYKYLSILVAAGVLVMAGCGKPGVTVATGPNGEKVEVDQNGKGSMTFDDGKGHKETVGTEDVTETELGVPFYPNSTPMEHGNLKGDDEQQSTFTSMRNTPDGAQKVVDFYKDAFAKAGYTVAGSMVMNDLGSCTGKKGEGDMLSLTYTHDKDKNVNMIMLSKVLKKGGATPSGSPAPSGMPTASPSASPS